VHSRSEGHEIFPSPTPLGKNEGDIASTESKSKGILLLLSPNGERYTRTEIRTAFAHYHARIRTHVTTAGVIEGSRRGEDVHVELA